MGASLQALQRTGPLTADEQAISWAVVQSVLLGATPKMIEEEGGPPLAVILNWLQRDPVFTQVYNRAREISAYALEHRILELSEDMDEWKGNNPDKTRRRTAHIENLKWAARVRNPGVFSDKATIQVKVPIQINTNIDMGEDEASRQVGNTFVIEANVQREVTAAELPEGATAVDLGDGHVGLVDEATARARATDAEIIPSEERSGHHPVSRIADPRRPRREAEEELPDAPCESDSPGHHSLAKKARRKATKVPGEKT